MAQRTPLFFALALITFSPIVAEADEGPASQPASNPVKEPGERPSTLPPPATTLSPAPEPHVPPATTAGPDTSLVDERQSWEKDTGSGVEIVRKGAFSLRFGGMIQVQAAFYLGEQGSLQRQDPADATGFRIRRARFALSGTLLPDVHYYLGTDLKDAVGASSGGDTGSEILDATISWERYAFVHIAVGVDKVPYSTFDLRSSSKLTLIERPLTTTLLAPDRRVGIRVYGTLGNLFYAAGLYNGSSGVTSGNRLGGLAAAIRFQYDLLGRPTGFVPRRFRAQLAAAYVMENGPTSDSHRAAVSVALEGFHLRLQGELLWQRSRPDAIPQGASDAGEVSRWGAIGQLSAFVYRDHLELAARFEHFRDNDRLEEFGRLQLISAGMNIYLCKHRLKLLINYINKKELRGPTVKNDIAFAQLQAAF